WYKLHSKTGKKEKERGELQLTVQFTRHNLTASMYDLSMKDKPRSAFIRLRERMRARKRGGDEESSSAIVPGGYGAIARVRGRLPSDGGGEEDYEDDEGGELRRSKMRSYFLHGRLRKSSDTRSSTSLGSESSESSSRGGSLSPTAGISVVVSDLSNSPSNSSNLTADNSPEHTVAPSPLVSPVRHVFDEVCDFSIPVPHSLTSDSDVPILLPSVCINGNPVETSPLTHQPPSLVLQQTRLQTDTQQEPLKTPQTSPPEKGKPTQAQTALPLEIKPQPNQGFQTKQPKVESKSKPELQFPAVGLLQKGSAHSLSLQNLSRHKEEQQSGGPVDGRRWSFDKPGEEEKAAIAAALEHTGLMADETEVEAPVSVSDVEVQGKKKRSLFSHARAEKGGTGQAQPSVEGRHRSWFSSKDTYSKPSSANYQPEVPASRPRNPTPPLDLAEVGNTKGTREIEDGLSVNFTYSFGSTDTPDDSDQYTQWDNSIGDGQKLTSNNNTLKTIPTFTCLTEPTALTPIYSEGDLVVSNKPFAPVSLCSITPASAIIVGALPHFEAEVNFTADLNNFVPLDASDSSLPHNSSIDFSELNALACPYPALSNCTFIKHKDNAVSICQKNITPDAMSVLSVSPEPSALNSESLPYLGLDEMFEQETLKCLSSKRKTDDTELCVENQNTLLPYTNFDTLCIEASSNVTAEFLSRSFNNSESKLKGHKTFKSDDGIKKGDGDVELQDSGIKEKTFLDVHEAAYSLGLPNPLGSSDFVLQGRLTMEMDAAGNPGFESLDRSEVSFVEKGFDVKNSNVLVDSSSTDSSNMSFTKEKVTDSQPNASKRNFSLPETLIGGYEEETPNGSREMLSSALSHGHSLYESVDSEHYLTCMSQLSTLNISQFSPVTNLKSETFQEAQPKTGLSQDVQQTNDRSPWTISEVQEDPAEISQDALPKNGDIFQSDPLNPPVSETFLPKTVYLQNTFEKDDINKVIPNAVTIQNVSIQKCDSPMDKMTDDFFEIITTRLGEEPLLFDPQAFMYNDMSSTESHQSYHVQCDGPLENMEKITNFCQSPENVRVSDFLSGSTSSITQDLVMTDLLLENMFVAQHVAAHSVGTSPVAHPVPREICTKMELCPDSIKASQTSTNTQATTTTATVPQGEYLHSAIHWSTIQPPPPEPSTLDWLTSGHDLLTSSSLSLLDLSPLASSTPHVAVGINSLPLSSFPMPSAPAKSLAHTTEAAASLPPVFAASHEFFPQEERQVACHLSSPHPVKPLTPPDEKRSEGRSVLEKLKSTINPGRSYQGDQESEKK
ncbi:rab11 family-interacting protein 5-like isoform X3, partial [Clarias magur]